MRIVLEVEVVDHGELRERSAQAEVSVRREEGIRPVLAQRRRQHTVEPDAVEQGVARGRRQYHGADVGGVYEACVVGPVEEVDELVLGMCRHHAAKRFLGEPADAFQLSGQQQAGVHGDAHGWGSTF